jgi:hypothetical protein
LVNFSRSIFELATDVLYDELLLLGMNAPTAQHAITESITTEPIPTRSHMVLFFTFPSSLLLSCSR